MQSIARTIPAGTKAIVFDVAASSGGAMSVLSDFYEDAVATMGDGTEIYLVHSSGDFKSIGGMNVLRYSWPKRSWLLRVLFEVSVAPRLVRSSGAGSVVSLQNIMVPFVPKGLDRILLVHTCLPFIEERFSLWREPRLWVYQRVIARMIVGSIRRSTSIVVQTEWMKAAILGIVDIPSHSILVIPPPVPEVAIRFDVQPESFRTFFYPAMAAAYKNHALVLEASRALIEQGVRDFRVILTVDGTESKKTAGLKAEAASLGLPIDFSGTCSREEALRQMASSVLVFPSYAETFGLPLLEARQVGAPVLAADRPFSREVLDGYPNARFFDPFSAESLRAAMAELLATRFNYQWTDS